jgi:hypothetical protein
LLRLNMAISLRRGHGALSEALLRSRGALSPRVGSRD